MGIVLACVDLCSGASHITVTYYILTFNSNFIKKLKNKHYDKLGAGSHIRVHSICINMIFINKVTITKT
jgi:hypothetical protein